MTGWSEGELGRSYERLERRQDEFERRLDALPGMYLAGADADRMEARLAEAIRQNRDDLVALRKGMENEQVRNRSQVRGAVIAALFSLLTTIIAAVIVAQIVKGGVG